MWGAEVVKQVLCKYNLLKLWKSGAALKSLAKKSWEIKGSGQGLALTSLQPFLVATFDFPTFFAQAF